MNKRRRVILIVTAGLFSMCILTSIISALSNQNLPSGPEVADRLSELDKARLAETLRLKQELGTEVWPGWDQSDIPVLLWSEEYSFLAGYSGQPKGWVIVKDDTFNAQPYYTQPTKNHQNFAVLIDDQWVASLATKWEMDNFIIRQFKEMIPAPINQIIPYMLFIQPSEVHITGVLHETFHVYQILVAPDRLDAAEDRYKIERKYWAVDEAMRSAWKEEVNLLVQAIKAESDTETITLVSQFLAQRDQRRVDQALDEDLIDFERLIEWEEGLAKYVELATWKQASLSSHYHPLPEMSSDPNFKEYSSFEQRWSQEITTMKNQVSQASDTRFYYTGMAQAFLLDLLMPDWKSSIFSEGVWLEDLLREAVEKP